MDKKVSNGLSVAVSVTALILFLFLYSGSRGRDVSFPTIEIHVQDSVSESFSSFLGTNDFEFSKSLHDLHVDFQIAGMRVIRPDSSLTSFDAGNVVHLFYLDEFSGRPSEALHFESPENGEVYCCISASSSISPEFYAMVLGLDRVQRINADFVSALTALAEDQGCVSCRFRVEDPNVQPTLHTCAEGPIDEQRITEILAHHMGWLHLGRISHELVVAIDSIPKPTYFNAWRYLEGYKVLQPAACSGR